MDKIKNIRREIDTIDQQIMELLDNRYRFTTLIGQEKDKELITIFDQSREELILAKASKFSHKPQIEAIYKTIMYESRKLQRK